MTSERYAEVIEGENLIWNNKFDEADKLFEKKKDTSARYALHYAESAFLRSFITGDQEDTHLAMQRLKATKDLAAEQMRAFALNPNTPKDDTLDAAIVYGDALYMVAILQMTRDAKIKGALNLRKSWKVFEKALKESKGATVDVEITRSLQFGAGFFLFAMSIIPQKFLKLVELAGFKADRDAGLHYVKECHKNGGIRGPFATMLLLFNNLLLPRGLADASQYLAEADQLIQESLKKYPTGSLFHVMGSHCARKQCNVEKGIELMEIALENSKSLKPPLIYRYELGNCYCMKLGFKKAIELYEPLISVQKFQVRGLCALQLAAAYLVTGEKTKGMDLLQKINLYANKGHLDNTVLRQAKRYALNGGHFAAFELLYLRRDLAKMLPILKDVLQLLDKQAANTKAMIPISSPKKPETPKSKLSLSGGLTSFGKMGLDKFNQLTKKKDLSDSTFDDRASYLLIKGSILKALGKPEEAVVCYKEVVEVLADLVNEQLYIPYCLYELGETYYTGGKPKEAEELMKKCSKYSGYDWEDPLRVRLRVTMEQLKKGTLPPNQTPISLEQLAEQNIPDVEDKIEIEKLEDDDDLEGSDSEAVIKKLSETTDSPLPQ
jgi:tetratricopeptide (TPR) repeat protein